MSKAYVGVSSAPVELETLQQLINDCIEEGWLFLRWPHKVLLESVKESFELISSCKEGQVFNNTRELRWRKQGARYEILLLSEEGGDDRLSPLGKEWNTVPLEAKAYPETETRFPRSISIPDSLNLGQRCFVDVETACVQFVALRAM